MREIVEMLHNYSDEELAEVLKQMDDMNHTGGTDKEPLRTILDSCGNTGLVTSSIIIYKEAAERWLLEHNK